MAQPDLKKAVTGWLESCKRKGGVARNTVVVGIVALDHLRCRCPVTHDEMFSRTGGEVRGARGAALHSTLGKYGIPANYLKQASTRQASHDAERLLQLLDYGRALATLTPVARDEALVQGIAVLCEAAAEWFRRQNVRVNCNRAHSPATWVRCILTEAEGKSGGRVEQHLVGAKLQKRHPDKSIPNYPGHAGDVQTGRKGDFDVDWISYHVTTTPGPDVIRKCKANAESNRHPVLVVPRDKVDKARTIAEVEGIDKQLTILALEDFIADNVIEISIERQTDFLSTLKDIIDEYNRRVQEVENEAALRIELQ
jgi:hypothetical protein